MGLRLRTKSSLLLAAAAILLLQHAAQCSAHSTLSAQHHDDADLAHMEEAVAAESRGSSSTAVARAQNKFMRGLLNVLTYATYKGDSASAAVLPRRAAKKAQSYQVRGGPWANKSHALKSRSQGS